MTGQAAEGFPERKPYGEMTRDEQREYAAQLRSALRRELAELNRPKRQRQLRRGAVKPRNMAEWEIFATDLTGGAGRQLRGSGRRRNADRAEPFEGLPMAEALEAESDRGGTKRGPAGPV